jgi:pimeloyl-ACP methyl ester carboxylesterase
MRRGPAPASDGTAANLGAADGPGGRDEPTPEHERFELTTADGLRLMARWWAPTGPADPIDDVPAVVLVHGFGAGQDLPGLIATVQHLTARGLPVLTYDGRGHRESGGMCTLGELERLDVEAAADAALERSGRIVLVGESMGGIAVLNHLAAGTRALGAVVVATPARWEVPRTARGLAAVALTQTRPGRSFVARRFRTRLAVRPPRGAPPVERIRLVQRPVAVVHGGADRFCLPAAALALHDALPAPKLLDIVPGMGHGFSQAALPAIGRALDWIVGLELTGAAAVPGADGPVVHS